ncbi:MAG TPA: hypothetical protein VJ718_03400, partial [Candidatus Binataceae bacterium]|nr:hypothetical protein [Candidatus Binataceae bacterium]
MIFFTRRAFRRGVGSEVTAPGFSPDGKNVQVAAPFFLTGQTEIQILEDTGSGELSSNYFNGLGILRSPVARAKPGAVTLGFLQGDLQLLQAAQQFASPGSPVDLQPELTSETNSIQNTIQ